MNWVINKLCRTQDRHLRNLVGISLLALTSIVACQNSTGNTGGNSSSSDGLEIWWSEGYYPEETEAIRQAVNNWSEEAGIPAEILFYSEKDLAQQSESAIAAGNPPDILYGYTFDFSLIPQLAWEGKLADTTDIIEPQESLYSPEALSSVSYQNNQAGNRSYYAVPISQQSTHIHYWKPLLAQINQDPDNIPTDWDNFWQFWVDAQVAIRESGADDIYALGLPMSRAATDTSYQFEQFLEAYNVTLISEDGQLLADNANVRSGIIQALTDYTRFYLEGDVPPNASDWGDPDNNQFFLSRLTLMTANPTMSIPGSQRQDPTTYNEQMVTILWPDKPNDQPMRYVTSIKQVAILADSDQLDAAKSFVSYLIQPDVLSAYIEGAQGRVFPVMPELLQESIWTDESDPHTAVASQQFQRTRPFPTVYNPAYSQVQAENIWGEMIRSVIVEGVSPEDATDNAIATIKQIFSEWE
ncbi:MAG: carbohydrate ABC transporter substrate-binding protein [Leptolyngbya sp. SIO1D8]|nr:carbohydrate ABC transporter substrate-binding protein [Leptolyngbya sp. SIO1D8]